MYLKKFYKWDGLALFFLSQILVKAIDNWFFFVLMLVSALSLLYFILPNT